MQINIQKFKAVASAAKARTSDKRWQSAIDRAVAGVESGWWIVTELHDCLAVTTESGATYFVTENRCQCRAFENNQPCKHRCYVALRRLQETAPAPVPAPAPRVTRSTEREFNHKTGKPGRRLQVVRIGGWTI